MCTGPAAVAALSPAAVLLLLVLQGSIHVADCQGLSISNEALGAGEAATAAEFSVFEEALLLASQTTGGRSIGSKGGTRLGASFTESRKLEQLQLSTYYISGSPKVYNSWNASDTGGINLVPPARDQGGCSTCVGQAVATAVQMAVSAALQRWPKFKGLRAWEVSPQSIYYCSKGGKTCKTGWDIKEALKAVIDDEPQLIRPTTCLDDGGILNNISQEPNINDWTPYCTQAARECTEATPQLPWLKCSYTSLSSFWAIQRHVRLHGAVITRITINSDFDVQFNSTSRGFRGKDWPAYKSNATARPLFPHAAVIVGYDNLEYTWTILNSWGNSTNSPRTKGITADGMFRVAMGAAGVGVPEETFGVSCVPYPGNEADLHSTEPWLQPRPVQLRDSANDLFNLSTECYHYVPTSSDTVASVADAFGQDIRQLLWTNDGLFGEPVNITYKFGSRLSAEELQEILQVVQNATSTIAAKTWPPYVQCWHYDTDGVQVPVVCSRTTGTAACARNGTVECTLHYTDINVMERLTNTTTSNVPLNICNISKPDSPGSFDRVAYFADPSISQPRALFAFLKAVDPGATKELSSSAARCKIGISVLTTIKLASGAEAEWMATCDNATTMVTELTFRMQTLRNSTFEKFQPQLDAKLTAPLLLFKQLTQLDLLVYGGELPPQLGALSQLKFLTIAHYCLSGGLPDNWLAGWPQLMLLDVSPLRDAFGLVPEGAECGVAGPIPLRWQQTTMKDLQTVNLNNNRLSGYLPSLENWAGCCQNLDLSSNDFVGPVPQRWAARGLSTVNLANNKLEGIFPLSWKALDKQLGFLHLDGNAALRGCIPLDSKTTLTYSGTKLAGFCESNAKEIEQWQEAALNTTLKALLLTPGIKQHFQDMIHTLVASAIPLGKVVQGGEPVRTLYQQSVLGLAFGRASLTVSVINGAAYVTAVNVVQGGFNASNVAPLARALPMLESLFCDNCAQFSPTQGSRADHVLPADLAHVAPHLKVLRLPRCNLAGQLPASYGNWSSLQELALDWNFFTGSLPQSYAYLSSLKYLELSSNILTGSLPPEWGTARLMPSNVELRLENNSLSGTVPPSWAHFSAAKIYVRLNNITGCAPDGVRVVLDWANSQVLPFCGLTNPEVKALYALLDVLRNASQRSLVGASLLAGWAVGPGGAGPNTPPKYCRSWPGVACNAAYQVISLDLSGLRLNLTSLTLSRVVNTITKLERLQGLNLSGLGLAGVLPEVIVSFRQLQTLNLSNNPGLEGSLPPLWASLSSLRTLDVSGCRRLQGSLPPEYAALQQLQVFMASGTGISGVLPGSYGLLKSLVEFDVSDAQLQGSLPSEWTDPFALRAAAAEVLCDTSAAAAAASNDADAQQQAAGTAVAAAKAAVRAQQQLVRSGTASTPRLRDSVAGVLLTQLQVLRLRNNNFTGQLPASWHLLPALRVLDVSVAAGCGGLTGLLPPRYALMQQLKELRLAGHQLNGTLPLAYTTLSSLRVLDVSRNKLWGQLPDTISGLYDMQQMNFSKCNFSGPLPQMLFGLQQLEWVDFSSNKFTGVVPTEWGRMRTGGLYKLQPGGITLTSNCFDKQLEQSIQDAGLGGFVVRDSTSTAFC